MGNATEILTLTRSAAKSLLEREERNTGSRMAAYERVAQMVGASPSWLRKFVSGDAAFPLTPFNILAQYERLCSRVELEAQVERERAFALKGQIDAAISGSLELVERPPDTKATRKKTESGSRGEG